MNQRLLQFLSAENISQAQFADTIGVARASVSHILAGRNKPGFDFIESMSSHFPDLSLEWLINGKGKMYKSMSPAAQPIQSERQPAQVAAPVAELPPVAVPDDSSLFAVSGPVQGAEVPSAPLARPVAAKPQNAPEKRVSENAAAQSRLADGGVSSLTGASSGRNISRIIVFYDDNTYQELK